MKKVLLSEKITEKAIKHLENSGFKVVISSSTDEETMKKEISDAYGLIMRATELSAEIIKSGKNLKIISRHGTGIDNIDVNQANKQGILVAKVNGANSYSVAEYVLTCMLMLNRRILKSNDLFRSGKLCVEGASLPGLAVKYDLNGYEIHGKKLAILGLGKVGRIVVRLAKALDMEVVGYDPFVKEADIPLIKDLDVIYKTSDFISINMPLTEDTKNMISKRELQMMKNSAFIINAGRGGIVNENDLAEALNSGEIAGAALDVFMPEPPRADNPLLKAKNVILTSHIAGTTYEASEALALGAAQAIIDFSKGKMPKFTVNPEVFKEV